MCGITGFTNFSSNKLISKVTLKKMSLSIAHRGPDNLGLVHNDNFGLAHNRLSIIDLSSNGNQPMVYKNFTMVYNGEIYNFLEIKSELLKLGYQFYSKTDSEVILKAFHCWGVRCFRKLNGIFALAIYDSMKDKLVLCRDRLGVKPLYYTKINNLLIFGSEIKAILNSGLIENEINHQALSEYMFFVSPMGNQTIYNGINKLSPGSFLTFDKNKFEIKKFWKLKKTQLNISYEDAASRTRYLIEKSVQRQLMSDVQVSTFLSGGIDSSAVTLLAAKHYPAKLNTYSVEFDYNHNDKSELDFAKKISNLAGSNHNELFISGDNIENLVEELVYIHDEPFADAANIPLYLMCKELKNEEKVVLQGDGGDEVFGGYNYYNYLHKVKNYSVPAKLLKFILNNSGYIKSKSIERLQRIANIVAEDSLSKKVGMLISGNLINENYISTLSKDLRGDLKNSDPILELKKIEKNNFSDLDYLQAVDLLTILPNQFLEKVDRPTMFNAIESRVPFLDNNLVDFIFSLPQEYKFGSGIQKKLLKDSMRNIVPDVILDAPKRGFGVPFEKWLMFKLKDFMNEVFYDKKIIDSNLFDYENLESKIQKMNLGYKGCSIEIWRCLNLAIWYKNNF